MPTASVILTAVKARFGDSGGDFITNARGLDWLDSAQTELVTKFMPLDRLTGFVVSANQEAFAIPGDSLEIDVVWHSRAIRSVLKHVEPVEFFRRKMVAQSATGYPVIWTEFEARIYVWPMYGTADSTIGASGAITAATTEIGVTSVSGFQIQGLLQVASSAEIVQYTNTATGNIKGCIRGYAGTTAASFASTGTVTQMSLQVLYKRNAASLATVTDTPDLPTFYHKALEEWALYLAYAAEGSGEKAQAQYQIYQRELEKLEYQGSKQAMGPLRIVDAL